MRQEKGTGRRVLRVREVCQRLGVCRDTIYEKIRAGDFPRPIKLGEKATGFLESEVDAWLDARIVQRDRALKPKPPRA